MRKFPLFFLGLSGILSVLMFCLELDAGENPKADERNPQRIVSLCLPVTEIICQMGMEDRIVGICEGDCPEKVKGKPKVGKAFGILNVEAVIALKPDLVFCWGDGRVLMERGLKIYSLHAKDLDGVIKLVEEVADLLGEKQKAVVMVAAMSEEISMINKKMLPVKAKPLIYFEAGSTGRTRGPGSLTNELIEKAGGSNLAGNEKVSFPLLSTEFIIASNPDIILVEDFGESNERIKVRSGWQDLKAVKNNRIFRCPSYYTNYSPRCVEGLEQFAHWFHPGLFAKEPVPKNE